VPKFCRRIGVIRAGTSRQADRLNFGVNWILEGVPSGKGSLELEHALGVLDRALRKPAGP
jgi:hypothetical protein